MLNYIWSFMVVVGVFVSILSNNLDVLNQEILESSKSGVQMIINTSGLVIIWSGLLNLADKSGMLEYITSKMSKVLSLLFPQLVGTKAMEYICINVIANFFGLAYVATPAGVRAMTEMQSLNKNKKVATIPMCNFMLLNLSSLQLISVNIIALRSEYGSANPQEIVGAGLLATTMTTILAILIIILINNTIKE